MRRFLAIAIVAFGVIAAPASARDLVVNTTADPATPDNSCTTVAGGCTIRDALDDATATDRVIVPSGTYNLTQGPLQLVSRTIVGAGARSTIIDAGGAAKALYVTGGTNQVSGVTLRNGGGVAIQAPAAGGAVLVTSTFAPTNLTLTGVTVSGSHSSSEGGGVASVGSTLTMINSTVSNNVTFDTGSTTAGGGLAVDGGGTTTLRNSTISNNSADSTEAPTSAGGGVYVAGSSQLVTEGTTIAANAAPLGPGFYMTSSTASASMSRTIIAGNRLPSGAAGPACDVDSSSFSADLSIADDDTCAFAGSPRNPQLGPLANNGGPTDTHALATTSPAINGGGLARPPTSAGCHARARATSAHSSTGPGLTVIKHIINDDGGTATAADFSVHVLRRRPGRRGEPAARAARRGTILHALARHLRGR